MSKIISNPWFGLIAATLFALLLFYAFQPVLELLILAFVFAYIARPLTNRLVRWGVGVTLSNALAYVAVFLILLVFLGSVVPVLSVQFKQIAVALPQLEEWWQQNAIPYMHEWGLEMGADQGVGEYLELVGSGFQTLGQVLAYSTAQLYQSGTALLLLLLKLSLFPVIAFYLVKNYDAIVEYIADLVPARLRNAIYPVARECDQVLSGFVTGQLSLMVVLAAYYIGALWLIGLQQAFLIGLVIGVLCFIPLLGTLLGLLLVLVSTLLQFGDWFHLGVVLLAFVIGQLLENLVLAPFLLGSKLGLHPVAVLLGLLVCGHLFGFMGILLALPITVVALVVFRHLRLAYMDSTWHA